MSTPADQGVVDVSIIGEPGVYFDVSDDVYHADPVPGGSLSVSGARLLLPPSCPARFAYQREHGRSPKKEFDLGHAAHKLVLGVGAELVVVRDEWGKNPDEWRTDAVKALLREIRVAGKVPLKPAEMDQVTLMAEALRQHKIAAELFNPARMHAEVSIFWHDREFGIMRRGRLDAVSTPDDHGAAYIVDYKTTKAADLESISKAMHFYGYAMQAEWYCDGAEALHIADDFTRFLFVFQEVEPPYLVTVVEPDPEALRIGRERNRAALEVYRDCTTAGVWPAYTAADEIPQVSLPGWVERQYEQPESWEDIL